MQTILIIVAAIVGGFFIYNSFFKKQVNEIYNTQRPDVPLPTEKVPNDKIVLIRNVTPELIEKILQEFCNLYNQEEYHFLPQLSVTSDECWITFPYNTAFDRFCVLVNYLKYPCDVENYYPQLLAWCTPQEGEEWTTEEMINKRVMIFIPDFDDECDNVYLTTEDNTGYKMGFGVEHESQKLEKPVNPFIDLSNLYGQKPILKKADFK